MKLFVAAVFLLFAREPLAGRPFFLSVEWESQGDESHFFLPREIAEEILPESPRLQSVALRPILEHEVNALLDRPVYPGRREGIAWAFNRIASLAFYPERNLARHVASALRDGLFSDCFIARLVGLFSLLDKPIHLRDFIKLAELLRSARAEGLMVALYEAASTQLSSRQLYEISQLSASLDMHPRSVISLINQLFLFHKMEVVPQRGLPFFAYRHSWPTREGMRHTILTTNKWNLRFPRPEFLFVEALFLDQDASEMRRQTAWNNWIIFNVSRHKVPAAVLATASGPATPKIAEWVKDLEEQAQVERQKSLEAADQATQ